MVYYQKQITYTLALDAYGFANTPTRRPTITTYQYFTFGLYLAISATYGGAGAVGGAGGGLQGLFARGVEWGSAGGGDGGGEVDRGGPVGVGGVVAGGSGGIGLMGHWNE